jgi:dipeptidyl aminopeptidase/acylaminoacyl peptidase
VLSWAANDPGSYYILDLRKKSLKPFLARMPWIKPAQMAKVIPITYKARDGLLIHGYLTVPAGREPQHLPLIVYPHGGPWVRDSWEFDDTAQFLANRGYAVLQMNYRASVGYGDSFYRKGLHKIGREIQDDIEDGARWAVAQGITDPQRMAILGASYGGYSALMGLIQTPDLYRCGVSLAGVTDWAPLIESRRELSPIAYGLTASLVGDPVKQAAQLREVSPLAHVDRIQVPVLIVHGKDDMNVPYAQATALVAELDRLHKPYEFMSRANELHGFRNAKNKAEYFTRVDAFLAKYLPPDAAPASAPTTAAAAATGAAK